MRLASSLAPALAAAVLLGAVPANAERGTLTPTEVVWPAPVGARQPTQADLPPALRRQEGARTRSERAFDKNLRICRGC